MSGAESPPASPRLWLDAAESLLFGRTRPPPSQRLAEAGWRPEPVQAACPRCGGSVGPGEVTGGPIGDAGCAACRGKPIPWDRAVRLGPHEGVLRRMVLDTKQHGDVRAGSCLGRLLGARVRAAAEQAGIDPTTLVVVPSPTTTWRRMRDNQGVDHALTIARGVARMTGGPVRAVLATRSRPRQTTLPASARRRLPVSAVWVVGKRHLKRMQGLVIVDDVRTTGATLRACCRAAQHLLEPAETAPSPRLWVATVTVAVGGRKAPENPGETRPEIGGFTRENGLADENRDRLIGPT